MKKNGVCSFEMDCGHLLDAENATMRYKGVMGKACIEFLEGEDKNKGIDIILNRDVRTRNYKHNKELVSRTAVIKLTVIEYSGKINPIGGNAD